MHRQRYRLRVALENTKDTRAIVRWFVGDFMPAVIPSLRRAPIPVSIELVSPEDDVAE